MKGIYIALITIACIVVLVGIGTGTYFGVKSAQKPAAPPISTSTSCTAGQILCNGVCCNNATSTGDQCVCQDHCSVVGSLNNELFCCNNPSFQTVINGQCCSATDNTSCIAGTPI